MATKTVNLVVCGLGMIGTTLLQILERQAQVLYQNRGLELKVVGLVASYGRLLNPAGIPFQGWREALNNTRGTDNKLSSIIKELSSQNVNNLIVVDTTSSSEVVKEYENLLRAGITIVAANKKGSSGPQSDFDLFGELTRAPNGPKLYIECNVGAGLPVISTLKSLLASGDRVHRIEAVLSGTLSFIYNTFSADIAYSQVVKLAKEKGYTEPDPRDDLSGQDMLRKVLILARIAGLKLEASDIKVNPLISEHVSAADTVDEFFRRLAIEDPESEARRKHAEEQGKRLRCIGTLDVDKGTAGLGVVAVDNSHPAYSLSGAANIVVFITDYYPESNPLVVRGPGAGAVVTAAGVLSDIVLASLGQ